MNVKRAVAAAGVIAALLLVIAVDVSCLAGHHHNGARSGAVTHAAAATQGAATRHQAVRSAPVRATLDIYGDSTRVTATYGDGTGVSLGTDTPGGTTTITGDATAGVTSGGVTRHITTSIYGD